MGSAHTHLSRAARCLDRSRQCPSRYVNKDEESSSWESRGPRLEAGLPGVAGAAEAPFQVGGDGRRVGLSPGAARLPAPLRALVGRVLALPFQTTEPASPHVGETPAARVSLEAVSPSEGVADAGTPSSVCISARACVSPGAREPRCAWAPPHRCTRASARVWRSAWAGEGERLNAQGDPPKAKGIWPPVYSCTHSVSPSPGSLPAIPPWAGQM